MGERVLRILEVGTFDRGGGTEKVAYNLHRVYHASGYPAWLVVRYKHTADPQVLPVPNRDCIAEGRFIPYQKDPKIVAYYYQAADVYVQLLVLTHSRTQCWKPLPAAAGGGYSSRQRLL